MKRRLLLTLLVGVLIFSLCGELYSKQKLTKAEKQAAKLAKMEAKLEKALGTNTSWKPTVLKGLRFNMPCKAVRKFFSGLKCNTYKKYDFPRVSGKLFGSVKEYKFTFKYGKLQTVTIIFGARIFDAKRFTVALLRVAQRKWGKLTPEKMAKPYKSWYNGDGDRVYLRKNSKSNWELEVSMPKRDTGDVKAAALTVKELTSELVKLLGAGNTRYLIPSLSKFRKGMNCNQVLQVYKTMKGCDPTKNYSRGTVTIKGHKLIHALKFSFNKGQLNTATLLFHRQIPKGMFKQVSLVVMEKKWGKLKPEKRAKDYISFWTTGVGSTRRSFLTDHWEIAQALPK